jgi:hypothetical protein
MNHKVSGDPTKAGIQGYLHRPLISWILGIVSIIMIGSDIVSLAREKLFWFDEAYAVLKTCTRPYGASGPPLT